MNYTKLVREYCKNNSGAIFDVSKLKDNLVLSFAHFGFMSDKPEFVEKLFNEYKTV